MNKLRQILSTAAISAVLMAGSIMPAAAAEFFNVTGSYDINFYLTGDPVTPYAHDADLVQTGSSVDGVGGHPANTTHTYDWDITSGTVSGNSINLNIVYTAGATGTVMNMVGTIAPNGTMSGTWTDDFGGARSGTWNTVAGAATHVAIPDQCDQTLTYNVIEGTNNSERINGTSGNDLIFAKNGDDRVEGKGGNDCILGGNGSDRLEGGNDNDVIVGEGDSDRLEGQDGNDKLYGLGGDDNLDGNAGDDELYGGAGGDSLDGGNDQDKLYGEGNDDSLKGGAGNDQLWGGAGADSLKGDAGTDSLIGEGGSDVANGGAQSDACDAEVENSCESNPV